MKSSDSLRIVSPADSITTSARRGEIEDRRLFQRTDDDCVLHRALFLNPADRAIVEGFYDKGMTAGQLAQLIGVHPGTVRRRTRQLIRHLRSPMFSFILAHRGQWSRQRRTVAEMHFLQRRPLRDTARRGELTVHIVRRETDAIRAQYEALCQQVEPAVRWA